MSEVKARAYAKINLFLRVLSAENGYHTIESLNQSVDLFDEIVLSKTEGDAVTSDFEGDNSLVVLSRIAEAYSLGGMRLSVKKNIPVGGGLGGSSADAAAAALACAELWGLDLKDVKKLVAPLFGDLAFQMTGGTAVARGFGEKVEVLPPLPDYHVLLCFPSSGVSTKEAYTLSDSTPKGSGDLAALYEALARGEKAQEYYLNDLLPAAKTLNAEIAPLLAAMQDEKALLTGMSGSGSTLFSLYKNRDDALKKRASLTANALVVSTIDPFCAK